MTARPAGEAPIPEQVTVLRDPVASRMLTAQGVTELGDFIGFAALALIAYAGTQSALGPAAVYAARTRPALAVATAFSGVLDVPPRRTLLVSLSLAGGALIAVPAAVPSPGPAIIAAGLLGAVRAAYRSVVTAVVAESVGQQLRLPFFGVSAFINQAGQVSGLLLGAAMTLTIGPRTALIVDAVSFAVAAGIFARLGSAGRASSRRRAGAAEGVRIIWRHRVLRPIALITVATVFSAGVPEIMAPVLVTGGWLPPAMAASSFGGAISALVAVRARLLRRVPGQLAVAAALALALVLGGVLVAVGAPPSSLLVANGLVGAGGGWLIGAQATFARLAPVERMGQVEATIVAANIVTAGCGTLTLGWLATRTGPASAYLLGGGLLLLAVLALRSSVVREARTTHDRMGLDG